MAILYLAALIAVGVALLGFAVDTVLGLRPSGTWTTALDLWSTLLDGPVDRHEGGLASMRLDDRVTAALRREERLESELEAA